MLSYDLLARHASTVSGVSLMWPTSVPSGAGLFSVSDCKERKYQYSVMLYMYKAVYADGNTVALYIC